MRGTNLSLMEMWIHQWEDYCGVSPRLSELFATEKGRRFLVLATAEREGREYIDPEIFAFLLIFVVWPEEELRKIPKKSDLKEILADVKRTRRNLKKLQNANFLRMELSLDEMVKHLMVVENQVAEFLKNPKVLIGNAGFFKMPAKPNRDRAKRQIIFFLTGYFRYLGWAEPDWKIIEKFLTLVGLNKQRISPKSLASSWSNSRGREITSDDPLDFCHGPIDGHQDSWVNWFLHTKEQVTAGRV